LKLGYCVRRRRRPRQAAEAVLPARGRVRARPGRPAATPAQPAPLDPPIAPISGDTLAWALPKLGDFANSLGVPVGFDTLADGHDGFHRPSERTINDRPALNHQVTALVHELAHALVDVDHEEDDPPLDYATGELVAESVAHIVCGFLGLDTSANSIPYPAVWSENADPDAFEQIAGLVDRLARRFEEALDAATASDAGVTSTD
jgi:hypothetical protein